MGRNGVQKASMSQVNPQYRTKLIWAPSSSQDGLTYVQCIECRAKQLCEEDPKKFPHLGTCSAKRKAK